ncbi:hypothetical protein C9374_012786 [Naegleria lovaniensis]|uniref:Splicing factor subunit n=1 Tax=Naegleria lovaniensis TaxID=51637 RepID=A0AA88GEK9_NAELO|nr:uncharacterized protein C9374_012786 [Naegleria lovaniensis]KAG2373184.1 hypothetical protein C9374_012786 [Naegleria lovaniensis]
MSSSDQANQFELLKNKFVGVGHADTTKFEWAVNQQRDTYSSYVSHYPMASYFAMIENESIHREKYQFIERMIKPCGNKPQTK